MKYDHFGAAIYCPVQNLIDIDDLNEFGKQFEFITRNVKVDKIYLETYRGGVQIDREKMLKLKAFFGGLGIKTSGGITTDPERSGNGGFDVFCYTNPANRRRLQASVEFTAGLFDEIILDDFYFTNCKCDDCISAKGDKSWAEYRTEMMREVSRDVFINPAKKVNPNVNMIIKYPNWYEHYQESGYNLKDEPLIFDSIYTGTETRNPQYTQQHLPKYLSYFNMRYLENVKPGKNMGGWFDPYECSYNLTSYADQAYLTLLGRAKEATLFSLGSLLNEEFSLCIPLVGQVFASMDKVLGQFGSPIGTACYLPYHSSGEDYLHNYLGMMGIPLEPYPYYPTEAHSIFLTESAAMDESIIEKIQASLKMGATVIVTSGFVGKTRDKGFRNLAKINVTPRRARVNRYAYSLDGGVCFGGCAEASEKIIIPQLEYPTNDTWELVGAFGEDNSFPILLKTSFSKGKLYVLTIPDDYGQLYELPRAVLKPIRDAFQNDAAVVLDSVSKVTLFTYDNDTFLVRSFRPYIDEVNVIVKRLNAKLQNMVTGKVMEGVTAQGTTVFKMILPPSANRVFKIVD